MNLGSPLGRYSQAVAAGLATLIVAVALGIRVYALVASVDLPPQSFIDSMAFTAMGAVFGAAASTAVNGAAIEAVRRRLNRTAAPPSNAAELEAAPDVETNPTP